MVVWQRELRQGRVFSPVMCCRLCTRAAVQVVLQYPAAWPVPPTAIVSYSLYMGLPLAKDLKVKATVRQWKTIVAKLASGYMVRLLMTASKSSGLFRLPPLPASVSSALVNDNPPAEQHFTKAVQDWHPALELHFFLIFLKCLTLPVCQSC